MCILLILIFQRKGFKYYGMKNNSPNISNIYILIAIKKEQVQHSATEITVIHLISFCYAEF